ncbi:MAG TPA: sugar phosphate isomerase/epimerase [Desulfatiglandales bacterium]|nr:sugar phosphate isomerase/epimerase [Desulfatiglandales bacterium]
MLGISTCFWSDKKHKGDEIVSDILDLGLKAVEIEYRISNAVLIQMKPMLKGELTVLSVHNYFPRPEYIPVDKASGDLFFLSSTDTEERSKAVSHTINTIEHAHDLGARVVVLHLGKVDMPDPTEEFFRLYKNRRIGEKEGSVFIEGQKLIREAGKNKNLDAVLFSMEKLNKEAEKRGILLGIENRYHFHEIPDMKEIGLILQKFKGGNIRYWHDVGHAKVQEKLGLTSQKELLQTYSKDMAGIHLHDLIGLDDHLAPGLGEMDYSEIKPFLKPSTIKILEVHPKVSREDLIEGIAHIKRTLLDNNL